jgi:hypothetical protein
MKLINKMGNGICIFWNRISTPQWNGISYVLKWKISVPTLSYHIDCWIKHCIAILLCSMSLIIDLCFFFRLGRDFEYTAVRWNQSVLCPLRWLYVLVSSWCNCMRFLMIQIIISTSQQTVGRMGFWRPNGCWSSGSEEGNESSIQNAEWLKTLFSR